MFALPEEPSPEMTTFIQFLLLGLGVGSIYALLALGTVLVYRGSGIVNFAHGSLAMVGAIIYYEASPIVGALVAVLLAIIGGAAAGLAIQFLLMRPLRRASPIARVIATLGVLVAAQQAANQHYGNDTRSVNSFLPKGVLKLGTGIAIPMDRVWVAGIALVLMIALGLIYRRTLFGLATTAVAENSVVSASLGWSPVNIATVNWAGAGGLAGLAGALLIPITGMSPDTLALVVLPALAGALLGGFSSFPITYLGALLVGVLESECTYLQAAHPNLGFLSTTGLASAVPFVVIIIALLIRGKALPLRSHLADRLPRIGTGRLSPTAIGVGVVVVVLSLLFFSDNWVSATMTGLAFGFIALSLVVVLGYAGQLSLAQAALAGVGALIAGRMSAVWGLPFLAVLVLGVALTIPVGVLIALPALRVRGVALSVVTLGLALVIASVVLNNPAYTGGILHGTVVKTPELFGLSLDPLTHKSRYAIFVLVLFVIAALAVLNLRRNLTGKRLIAIRNNERAAASLGISVVGHKVYAFAVAAGLAALGGILGDFQHSTLTFDQFAVPANIEAITQSVIGGVGFLGGGMLAAFNASGGPLYFFISLAADVQGWYLVAFAVLLLVVLIVNPDGIASVVADQVAWVRRRMPRTTRGSTPPVPDRVPAGIAIPDIRRRGLVVEGLSVSFGSVRAVDGVTLRVDPGEVVGLIGPNGAGKTTFIDAVTGFVQSEGRVTVGDADLSHLSVTRRARKGLSRSFQSLELFDDLTVRDNLRTAVPRTGIRSYLGDLVRLRPQEGLSEVATAAAEMFGLAEVLDRLPGELPYAQRRSVAVARAVAGAQSVLLLDEPAAGLDDASTRELGETIRQLAADWGLAVLLVEHDVPMVMRTCDRIVAISFGQELITGTPAEVRSDGAVISAYLGTEVDEPAAVLDRMEMPS